VRMARLCGRLLGFEKTIVEGVEFDGLALVVRCRPTVRARSRCGVCRRRAPGYDQGSGLREWRALDAGAVRVVIRAVAVRVECVEHGVVAAWVPWARHASRHTLGFEDQVAWLACETSKSAICELMRVSWRTVGAICERVLEDGQARFGERLDGLSRIGIDEISFRRGHRYLTVVVCHQTGRLVWAAEGRDTHTLGRFFDALGAERAAEITHVSADMGPWVHKALAASLPHAVTCIDPFHVVALATAALDDVRRDVWNQARRAGDKDGARWLKGARWALWKNPERLTDPQGAKLELIKRTNEPLYSAYLLKEQLRETLREPDPESAHAQLKLWIEWASQSGLAPFARCAQTIADYQDGIIATIRYRLTNARVEAVNTTLRLVVRRAYGFHSAQAMIALATLKLGGYRPTLPNTA
jgi:transposase